jgi:hypothetical protein
LIVWETANNLSTFENRLLINGTLASLNTIWETKDGRINYINTVLNWSNYEDYIDLYKWFTWRCQRNNDTFKWTDDSGCSSINSTYWKDVIIVIPSDKPNILLK